MNQYTLFITKKKGIFNQEIGDCLSSIKCCTCKYNSTRPDKGLLIVSSSSSKLCFESAISFSRLLCLTFLQSWICWIICPPHCSNLCLHSNNSDFFATDFKRINTFLNVISSIIFTQNMGWFYICREWVLSLLWLWCLCTLESFRKHKTSSSHFPILPFHLLVQRIWASLEPLLYRIITGLKSTSESAQNRSGVGYFGATENPTAGTANTNTISNNGLYFPDRYKITQISRQHQYL